MNSISNKSLISIDSFYRALFHPILIKDKGIDAELLSQVSLNVLEKFSIYRESPVIKYFLQTISFYPKKLNNQASTKAIYNSFYIS